MTLVGLQVVRFLGMCEENGTELLYCPSHILQWIAREQRQ